MKISHLVLCGGLTLALLLSGCADSNTKTTSKKTVPRTTVVTTIIPGEVGTDQNRASPPKIPFLQGSSPYPDAI